MLPPTAFKIFRFVLCLLHFVFQLIDHPLIHESLIHQTLTLAAGLTGWHLHVIVAILCWALWHLRKTLSHTKPHHCHCHCHHYCHGHQDQDHLAAGVVDLAVAVDDLHAVNLACPEHKDDGNDNLKDCANGDVFIVNHQNLLLLFSFLQSVNIYVNVVWIFIIASCLRSVRLRWNCSVWVVQWSTCWTPSSTLASSSWSSCSWQWP